MQADVRGVVFPAPESDHFVAEVAAVIGPFNANVREPPIGIERVLRVHFVQHRLTLSGLVVEAALHGSFALLPEDEDYLLVTWSRFFVVVQRWNRLLASALGSASKELSE